MTRIILKLQEILMRQVKKKDMVPIEKKDTEPEKRMYIGPEKMKYTVAEKKRFQIMRMIMVEKLPRMRQSMASVVQNVETSCMS